MKLSLNCYFHGIPCASTPYCLSTLLGFLPCLREHQLPSSFRVGCLISTEYVKKGKKVIKIMYATFLRAFKSRELMQVKMLQEHLLRDGIFALLVYAILKYIKRWFESHLFIDSHCSKTCISRDLSTGKES